jgi:hypothetical protein
MRASSFVCPTPFDGNATDIKASTITQFAIILLTFLRITPLVHRRRTLPKGLPFNLPPTGQTGHGKTSGIVKTVLIRLPPKNAKTGTQDSVSEVNSNL